MGFAQTSPHRPGILPARARENGNQLQRSSTVMQMSLKMKSSLSSLPAVALLMAVPALAQKVTTDFDKSANFYRREVWKRFGAVGFFGAGEVAPTFGDFR